MTGDQLMISPASEAPSASTPDISVVIPCYNEQENVVAIISAVRTELLKCDVTYEIIIIDNNSSDATVALTKQVCAQDPCVCLIVNNRNYGQMRSPAHGVYQARGRAVISLSADFQDPPALIPEFIARWREGAKIVLGAYESNEPSYLLRTVRSWGYAFFRAFGDYPVIRGVTGFGLYDREVVDCLSKWREPEPFFRGMLVDSGYSLVTIPFERAPRAAGATKNNFFTLFSVALSGVASSSKSLLRAPFYLAAGTAAASGIAACGWVLMMLLNRSALTFGIAFLIELNFSFLFLALGVMGEQVRVISERTRNVPLVVERERVNF